MKKYIRAAAIAVGVLVSAGMAQVAEAGKIILEADGQRYSGNVGAGEFRVTKFTEGGVNVPVPTHNIYRVNVFPRHLGFAKWAHF